MRFFLDEDYSPIIARLARAHGVDIVSSHESGRNGLPDEAQLRLAADDGRCFVTENRRDFIRLTHAAHAQAQPHAGVLLVSPSLPNNQFAAIAAALTYFDREHPDDPSPYTLLWLTPAPE